MHHKITTTTTTLPFITVSHPTITSIDAGQYASESRGQFPELEYYRKYESAIVQFNKRLKRKEYQFMLHNMHYFGAPYLSMDDTTLLELGVNALLSIHTQSRPSSNIYNLIQQMIRGMARNISPEFCVNVNLEENPSHRLPQKLMLTVGGGWTELMIENHTYSYQIDGRSAIKQQHVSTEQKLSDTFLIHPWAVYALLRYTSTLAECFHMKLDVQGRVGSIPASVSHVLNLYRLSEHKTDSLVWDQDSCS